MMNSSSNFHICTIGHSNHPIAAFIDLLKKYKVETLIDVRSYPVSKYQPQFNQENLEKCLNNENITYQFLGNLLGGRYKDPRYLYPDGVVDYNKVRERPEFQEGIKKVEHLIKEGKHLALMCAEKDPFDCHRFVLISKNLNHDGISIDHILNDGLLVSQESLEERLRSHYHILLNENLETLYARRNRDLFNNKTEKQQHSQKNKRAENLTFSDYSAAKNNKTNLIIDENILPAKQAALVLETVPTFPGQPIIPYEKSIEEKPVVDDLSILQKPDKKLVKVFTIGFTQKSAQQFFETLSNNNIKLLIDVRLNNKSQLAGFSKAEDLKYFLKKICGIEYIHMSLCAPSEELLKKYQKKEIKWPEYEKDYQDLMKKREVQIKFNKNNLNSACLLCSELKPDQCHRRLLAEYLKQYFPEIDIIHL